MERRILRSLLGLALIVLGCTWLIILELERSSEPLINLLCLLEQAVGLCLCVSAWLQAPKE